MSNLFARPTHFTEIDSTNRYLADRARAGDPEGGVAIADVQSAGRGRLGRSWVSAPQSSLLCSMLFRPSLALGEFHLVMTAVALGARQAIDELTGITVSLKWPNDLLVDDKKVAGLLAEIVETDSGNALIVGIGINLQWPEGKAPRDPATDTDDLASRATTLLEASGRMIDRDLLASSMLEHIERDYSRLADVKFRSELMQRYRDVLGTLGRRVRIEQRSRTYEADAIGVTNAGYLQIQEGTEVREIDAADVIHLRH
ncbi:MAG TPA: biotin--[acetyl-CoA-carboxylase] ligase [Acidimicrobiales bacterium]|nr:biotin--[acetyl-CoA-carboxylase] ligase [Acidimicrobiales bacterium]